MKLPQLEAIARGTQAAKEDLRKIRDALRAQRLAAESPIAKSKFAPDHLAKKVQEAQRFAITKATPIAEQAIETAAKAMPFAQSYTKAGWLKTVRFFGPLEPLPAWREKNNVYDLAHAELVEKRTKTLERNRELELAESTVRLRWLTELSTIQPDEVVEVAREAAIRQDAPLLAMLQAHAKRKQFDTEARAGVEEAVAVLNIPREIERGAEMLDGILRNDEAVKMAMTEIEGGPVDVSEDAELAGQLGANEYLEEKARRQQSLEKAGLSLIG